MKQLKGITWDHPRGYDSIVAASEVFHNQNDEIRVNWDIRSLKEFGDLPISNLIDKYDLLMIDHPFVGEAHEQNLLLPLQDVMSAVFLIEQSTSHISECYSSYTYNNHQYAIPIDAAAQFSAYNKLSISTSSIPQNWSDYLHEIKNLRFRNKVVWPLCPTDLWCSFFTLAAQIGNQKAEDVFNQDGLNLEIGRESFEYLKQLIEPLREQCWSLNPIGALDLLSKGQNYGFSPLLFGYSNYGRKGMGNVRFLNVLNLPNQPPISLMGGVGIAVSSKTKFKDEIATYLSFIMKDSVIAESYFNSGGQPSLESVWNSDEHNRKTSNFFSNTKDTISNAYIRPRIPGFNSFQEQASLFIHEHFRSANMITLVDSVNEIFKTNCTKIYQ